MSNNSSPSSGGIGFLGTLTIVFIVLKLLDKIAWSWWLVLAPTWVPLAVVGVSLLGVLICTIVIERRSLND